MTSGPVGGSTFDRNDGPGGRWPPQVIIIDWSAAATPSPRRPAPDACWIAYGRASSAEQNARPPPEYFRTRADCIARVKALLRRPGPSLVGVDFSLGYPLAPSGEALLPAGRALARWLGELVVDGPDNTNNRFEIAAALNRHLAARFGAEQGPFWGCPPRAQIPDLTPTRPPAHSGPRSRRRGASPAGGWPTWRHVEAVLMSQGWRPQSAWKLFTTGSVGSQTLLGLAALGRWLDEPELGPRIQLWPFDGGFRRPRHRHAIVVGEVWPTLCPLPAADDDEMAIKDARQVVAVRDAALALEDPWMALARPAGLSSADEARARREGWLLGVPHPIHACRSELPPRRHST